MDDILDPFEIIGEIPEGRVYQWCTLSVCGSEEVVWPSVEYWLGNGWETVAPERHPRMPAADGRIVVGGQVLLETSKEHAEAARQAEDQKVRDWTKAFYDRTCGPLTPGGPTRAISPPIVGSGDGFFQKRAENEQHLKLRSDAHYAVITLDIGVVLTNGEIETAAHLNLNIREYARRKFLMRADVLQRVNSGMIWRESTLKEEPPIFSFVRLTTTEE